MVYVKFTNMLPVYILTKHNIRPLSGVSLQWLKINVRSCSSSSDSSDSDSDTEKKVKRKRHVKSTSTTPNNKSELENFLSNMIQQTTASNVAKDVGQTFSKEQKDTKITETSTENTLLEYVNNMMKARKLEKSIEVAMQPRKKLGDASGKVQKKPLSYEKKLEIAAENVATTLGGDKAKTTSDLLQKVLSYTAKSPTIEDKKLSDATEDKKLSDATEVKKLSNVNNIQPDESSVQLIKKWEKDAESRQSLKRDKVYSMKKSIIHSLLKDYNQQPTDTPNNSISRQLLKDSKTQHLSTDSTEQQLSNDTKAPIKRFPPSRRPSIKQAIDIFDGEPSSIFKEMGDASPDVPELKTWAALKQKELKALGTYTPANIFQEMILWTEQGKLWKFPIDNEQGLDEEHNVHFSEHVFMERHLKGWCPKSGPIRHYMELVCTGLSKNPYLTVEEKISHIMWYKDYFKSKQDLLQDLEAIKTPFPDEVEQIAEK